MPTRSARPGSPALPTCQPRLPPALCLARSGHVGLGDTPRTLPAPLASGQGLCTCCPPPAESLDPRAGPSSPRPWSSSAPTVASPSHCFMDNRSAPPQLPTRCWVPRVGNSASTVDARSALVTEIKRSPRGPASEAPARTPPASWPAPGDSALRLCTGLQEPCAIPQHVPPQA